MSSERAQYLPGTARSIRGWRRNFPLCGVYFYNSFTWTGGLQHLFVWFFLPFLVLQLPFDRMWASEAANEGFSATINTFLILYKELIINCVTLPPLCLPAPDYYHWYANIPRNKVIRGFLNISYSCFTQNDGHYIRLFRTLVPPS